MAPNIGQMGMGMHTRRSSEPSLDFSSSHFHLVQDLHVTIKVDATFRQNKASVGDVIRINGVPFLCWGIKIPFGHSVTYSEAINDYVNSRFDQP